MLSLKRAFQKCLTWAGSPQEASPNASPVRFGAIFRAFPFSAPPPFFATLFPHLSLSHFIPPLPFPKEMNKKLSYRG